MQVPSYLWLLLLLLAIATALTPFFVIRRIDFRDRMVVKRYLLPDQFIDHKEVGEVSSSAIQTTSGNIRLGNLQNVEELKGMVQRWSAVKILKEAQRKGQPQSARAELPVRGFGSYGFAWALLIGIMAMYLQPPWLAVDPRWLFGISFLVVYVVFVYILPKKL